jgi:tetratricopeptide (TPR) repeat protein
MLPAAQAQDSLTGAMHYHKAEVILRNYEKAGKPQTREGQQQLQQALAYIEEAIKVAPEDGGLWYQKGRFYQYYLIDGKAALAAYQKSYGLRRDPQTAASLADVAIEVGEYQEAILVLNKIIRDAPAKNQATFALNGKIIIAYLLDRQYEQAKQVAEKLAADDHSLFTKALLMLTHGINDKAFDPPEDASRLREDLFFLYDLILKNDPILKLLDGHQWAVGFEDENEKQYVRNYFLPDESPQQWTEQVTLQVLKGDDESPADYLSGYKKYLKSSCDKLDWKNLKIKKSPDAPAAAAEWQADKPCRGIPHRYEVTRVVRIKDSMLARIAFISRTPDAGKQQRWRELIADMPLAESFTGGKRNGQDQ